MLPVYNEAESLDEFYATLTADAITPMSQRFDVEVVFIDDGSTDRSYDKIAHLAANDQRIVGIQFSRNFGHQVAVTAGLDHTTGDAVIIMDTDLQDPPRVCLELLEAWWPTNADSPQCDVVYAQRRSRNDTVFKRMTAAMFYWFLDKVSDTQIPRNTGDFRLADRRAVDAVARFPERDRFLRGLFSYIGFRQVAVPFDRDARRAGESGYPLRKMLKFAGDGIAGFSLFPLRLVRFTGFTVFGLAILGILYALAVKLFSPDMAVPGWAFTVIAILAIGGIQILMLGIIGSYLGRTHSEVRRRPLYIVAGVVGASRHEQSATTKQSDPKCRP